MTVAVTVCRVPSDVGTPGRGRAAGAPSAWPAGLAPSPRPVEWGRSWPGLCHRDGPTSTPPDSTRWHRAGITPHAASGAAPVDAGAWAHSGGRSADPRAGSPGRADGAGVPAAPRSPAACARSPAAARGTSATAAPLRWRPGPPMAERGSQLAISTSSGVWPRGAHVRWIGGRWEKPLSSRKRRIALRRCAFFNG